MDLIDVQKDDLLIVASDGLYDNMEFQEIEEIVLKVLFFKEFLFCIYYLNKYFMLIYASILKSKTLMDTAYNLVHKSVVNNLKPDDIIILVAKVVENKESANIKKFSVAPGGQ